MDARTRPHVDDVIRRPDRVFVMLDHKHAVAEIAQVLEGAEEPFVVALVQADRWLVQHVKHARQAGADLGCQANTLALAARQRAGGTGQRQVFQPDIDQKAQPIVDLLQDALCDLLLLLRQRRAQSFEPGSGSLDRIFSDLADMPAVELHGEGFGLQAIAATGLARCRALEFAQLLTQPRTVGLAPAAFEVGHYTFEGLGGAVFLQTVVIGEGNALLAGAVEDDVPDVLVQLVPGIERGGLVVLGDAVEGLGIVGRG